MRWVVINRTPMNTFDNLIVENGRETILGEVVIRRFDPPIVTPPGASKSLNLYVKNKGGIYFAPRDIIQFSMGEAELTPVFWGPIVTTPSHVFGSGPFDDDRDSLERVSCVGGDQLLRETVIGARLFTQLTDVSSIAWDLCARYKHPALSIGEHPYPNFPATGFELGSFYAPEKTLFDALTDLAQTVIGGASFWVDATGVIHFEANPIESS